MKQRLLNLEGATVKQAPGGSGWLPVRVHDAQTLPPAPLDLPWLQTANNTDHSHKVSADSITSTNNEATTTLPSSTDTPIGSLHVMSLAFLLTSNSTAVVWRGPKKTAMIRQFLNDTVWPPIDYLIIDTPPGTSDEHISIVESLLKIVSDRPPSTAYPNLAGAVIVTTPQAVAISDVRKEINFCFKVGLKVQGILENMSSFVCTCGHRSNIFSKGGGEVMARDFGVDFLGSIPIDTQWGQLVEEGISPTYGEHVEGKDDTLEEEDESREAVVSERAVEEEDSISNKNGDTEVEEQEDEMTGLFRSRDDGLLVDKYRACSLCPIFMDITRKLVKKIESERASVTSVAD